MKINFHPDGLMRTYVVLVMLRFALVFWPQLGYIHPDEFFQSSEIIAGNEFDLEHSRTWEFNVTFPVRSIGVQYVFLKVPLNFFRFVMIYCNHYLKIDLRTPYTLLVFPRFCMCLYSFINDWCLFKICRAYSLKYEVRLITLASSFVMLVFGTRTFSNTIEMALCSLLLYFVSDCMIQSNTVIYQKEFIQDKYKEATTMRERVRLHRIKQSLPAHSLNCCAIIATICVVGMFNRPTFIMFGMPIVFFWMLRGLGSKTVSMADFNVRMFAFMACALPSLIILTLMDSLYYGYLTLSEIDHLQLSINNFVFTPLNFVRYNINPANTGLHGVHPKWLHTLINIPLLFNLLGVAALLSFGAMVIRFMRSEYRYLPRAQSFVTLMTAAIFVPLILLSLINHQEARFLIPVTLPMVLLHAPKLQTGFQIDNPFRSDNRLIQFVYKSLMGGSVKAGRLLKMWFIINIVMTVFFGFIHQAGVYQVAEHFHGALKTRSANTHIHLVTSHVYSMPTSLLFLPSTKTLRTNHENGQKYKLNKRFFLYEYGGMDMDKLYKKLRLILDVSEVKVVEKKQNYQLFLAMPYSLSEDLNWAFLRSNSTVMVHERVKVFYPHVSTEAMPKLFGKHPCEITTDVFDLEQKCNIHENDKGPEPYSVASVIKELSSVVHQFGLVLYRIDVGARSAFKVRT